MKIKTKARVDHLEALLRRVREPSRFNQRMHRVRKYLGSYNAKLLATIEADEAMRRNLGAAGRHEAELESIASSLDPWKGTKEPVLLHRIPKDSPGEYRTVLEFEIENRAFQHLVRDVLIALVDLHPHQYATRGGVHAAVKHTKQALIDGYVWGVELDIGECYPSFDEEKLANLLPLPKEVIDHVIISKYLNIQGDKNTPYEVHNHHLDQSGDNEGGPALAVAPSSARRGIPQGSAASPLIAEAMIAIALKQVPVLGGLIIAYADNVLLLAKSESDVASMTKTLRVALEAHPVGRLRSRKTVFKAGQPIKFLGHVLSLTNGVVRIEPSEKKMQEFLDRVSSDLDCLTKGPQSHSARTEVLRRLEEYIQSWTASFSLCDDIEKIRSQAHAQVKEATMTYKKTFKLHPDQKEIVEAALADIKGKTGTAVDTVALEYMAQSYMGTDIMPTLKTVMNVEYKKAGDETTFLTVVAEALTEILGKGVTITTDEE